MQENDVSCIGSYVIFPSASGASFPTLKGKVPFSGFKISTVYVKPSEEAERVQMKKCIVFPPSLE